MIHTRKEALELAAKVMVKQKGDKREAMMQILQDYKVLVETSVQDYFQIVPEHRCGQCEGVILQKTHKFSQATCGGNPVIGCPACKTFSSGKMLGCREDIVSEKYPKQSAEQFLTGELEKIGATFVDCTPKKEKS